MIIKNIFKGSCLINTKQDGEQNYSHKLLSIIPTNTDIDDGYSDKTCYGYFSIDDLMNNNRDIYLVSMISDEIDSFSSSTGYHFRPLHFFLNLEEANLFAEILSKFCQNILNEKNRIREIRRKQLAKKINEAIFYDYSAILEDCKDRIKFVRNTSIDKIFYFNDKEQSIYLDSLQGSSIVDTLSTFQVDHYQVPIYKIYEFSNKSKSLSGINQFVKNRKDPVFG